MKHPIEYPFHLKMRLPYEDIPFYVVTRLSSSINRINELLIMIEERVDDTDAKRQLQESVGYIVKDLEPVGKFLEITKNKGAAAPIERRRSTDVK